MKHIVVGLGEVGSAVHKLLSERHQVVGVDAEAMAHVGGYDVMHVCFPYSKDFLKHVEVYQSRFGYPLTVIHSTVPVGTCEQVGPMAVHSPIRGVHPNLYEGLKMFVKFFGGIRARDAAKPFEECGVVTFSVARSRDTEAMKLWETEQYRRFILLNKEVKRWCDEHGVDFGVVYDLSNRTYNDGYAALGRTDVVRPRLKHVPGPIGGHCVEPNHKLLFPEEA